MLDQQKITEEIRALLEDLMKTKDKNVAFMKLLGYINKLKQRGGK